MGRNCDIGKVGTLDSFPEWLVNYLIGCIYPWEFCCSDRTCFQGRNPSKPANFQSLNRPGLRVQISVFLTSFRDRFLSFTSRFKSSIAFIIWVWLAAFHSIPNIQVYLGLLVPKPFWILILLGFFLSSLGRAKSSHGEGNQRLSPSFLKLCADFHTT